ncbi:YtpI family protein [Cohnella zeiphila]|uniref:YtpI family protein n=1 Tax=Cohnella zeiphila TaxID=2761120 RepID=A0A7X0SM98_9BACL|nr:YtpI family protein [Cohnella zeiphila]MBB6732613.1 YtpI family protein [Cohnella zeiphila]
MITALQWTFGAIVLVTVVLSVVFSYRSRRSRDPILRGLYGARMNICIGLTLIFLALIQMVLFSGSTLRVIVGSMFLVLGLFNLFAGIRNHSYFTKHRSSAR